MHLYYILRYILFYITHFLEYTPYSYILLNFDGKSITRSNVEHRVTEFCNTSEITVKFLTVPIDFNGIGSS